MPQSEQLVTTALKTRVASNRPRFQRVRPEIVNRATTDSSTVTEPILSSRNLFYEVQNIVTLYLDHFRQLFNPPVATVEFAVQ